MGKSIYEQLKEANIPLDSHESDLYAKVTPESEKIISEYKFKDNVSRFKDNINHQMWFDIPFAFRPYWEKRGL
jgi:hypothetical protein